VASLESCTIATDESVGDMMEITRSKAALDGWRKTSRACADCSQYAAVSDMITKADGRVICPSCQKAIETAARERAQADLFTSQPALF
jgi:hypothetical protein